MTSLVLGPLLRHVGTTTATIWVETSEPCTVEVLGSSARTFEVCGQHYGLVVVRDLEPATCRPYEVHLDGENVWPAVEAALPPSLIRTRHATDHAAGAQHLSLVFGSCRYPPTDDPELEASLGVDALDAYAVRLIERVRAAEVPGDVLPDAVCLLGDQVYADELTPRTERWIRARRDPDVEGGPGLEIADYTEYAHLYHESWTDRELRWLLSTVPTSMIFDDHDVRDDWNTSQAWRTEMASQPWWPQRIRAALASYWVYQHLGNLDPATRDEDKLYQQVMAAEGDVYDLLAEFAGRADAEVGEPTGVRWSYRWDLGRTRVLMIDSRCGRVLNDDERLMVNTHSFSWIEENATPGPDEQIDHLLLGSSIPWLMPPAVSHAQSMDEAAAARGSSIAEKLRQAVDLEHWPAFRASFDRLSRMIQRVASSSSAPAHRLRALRRRAPQLRRPGRLRATDDLPGLPADVLAGAQRRAVVHGVRLRPRVAPESRPGGARARAALRGGGPAPELVARRRAVVRQRRRLPGDHRPRRPPPHRALRAARGPRTGHGHPAHVR